MLTRRCVACGHEAAPIDLLNGHCPACSCDFDVRPPRTYAEMEGFEPVAAWIPAPFADVPPLRPTADRGRLRRRWMVFVLGVVASVAGLLVVISSAGM
jgi:hypothetical protein